MRSHNSLDPVAKGGDARDRDARIAQSDGPRLTARFTKQGQWRGPVLRLSRLPLSDKRDSDRPQSETPGLIEIHQSQPDY